LDCQLGGSQNHFKSFYGHQTEYNIYFGIIIKWTNATVKTRIVCSNTHVAYEYTQNTQTPPKVYIYAELTVGILIISSVDKTHRCINKYHVIFCPLYSVKPVPLQLPKSQPEPDRADTTPTTGTARREKRHLQLQAQKDVSSDDASLACRHRDHVGPRLLIRCRHVRTL